MQAEPSSPAAAGPLAGLRVLDCTHVVAGSLCSMILADLGADVVKIESPQGDMLRARLGSRGFASFPFMNRNKRSLAIDMSRPDAQEVLRTLADSVDVFVENYRPGALDRLGLGYAHLSARNPRLVYCSISGFGRTGPYSKRGGFDVTAQAMSGLMSFAGEPGARPVQHPAPISDYTAALHAAIGVLAALRERESSGMGQHVEATLIGSALLHTTLQLGEYLTNGYVAKPEGTKGSGGMPYGVFATADRYLVIAAAGDSLWQRTAAVLGDPELLADPRFASHSSRSTHREALRERIEAILAEAGAGEWAERLSAAGVPVGIVNTVAEAAADPQLEHLGAIVEVGDERYLATPINLSRSGTSVRSGTASLGEHSRQILAEAGFGADEIDAMAAAGLIAGPG